MAVVRECTLALFLILWEEHQCLTIKCNVGCRTVVDILYQVGKASYFAEISEKVMNFVKRFFESISMII